MKIRFFAFVSLVIPIIFSSCAHYDHSKQSSADTTIPSISSTASSYISSSPSVPCSTADTVEWDAEASIFRFLTEINNSGSLVGDTKPIPPGSNVPVQNIPQPNQALIGQTVSIALSYEQFYTPFYYSYDNELGVDRLAVIVDAYKWPLLLIMETELNDIFKLCDVINRGTAFDAKILAMTNISKLDAQKVFHIQPPTGSNNHIDPSAPTIIHANGCFIGCVGKNWNNDIVSFMLHYDPANTSDDTSANLEKFKSIFQRFDLLETVNP